MKTCLWKHGHMIRTLLDYDYDAAMLLKKKHLKKNSCLVKLLMPVNWNPFYDTSYGINQITSIHNIDVYNLYLHKRMHMPEL